MPELKDMKTWTNRLGHSSLRSFTDEEGHFWLEQNVAKPSKWGSSLEKAMMSRGSLPGRAEPIRAGC